MSGTSMAAPQIAGIGALVKQYIESKGLSRSDLTDRALAQSIMMSTASRSLTMKTTHIIPVIQQGSRHGQRCGGDLCGLLHQNAG